MTDEKLPGAQRAPARGADSRQGRLKLKLRENLKRRKSQAKARDGAASVSSGSHQTCPDGEVGKRGE